ncbi:hypothetical protein [Parvularcula sp. IMCC14364]|uniref:hypothetical protein n=1 Tax=Parvularcula sp. IMCC14364 TaxID=3067902 RepID=UPI0027406CD9|nr:hypothetical protein [Parvularcula sp. IMCC14364]
MMAFRGLLIVLFLTILVYTGSVISNHGIGLIPVFFGDMAKMAWPGQFNLDFMCFLVLSATWLAWRHHFSAIGLLLAVMGAFGGMLFLSAYLLWLTFQTNGNIREIMLGAQRA